MTESNDGLSSPPEVHAAWSLQNAKACFSELVRKAGTEGPRHVTVHGREAVVVVAAEEFRRLRSGKTGRDLLAVMQVCPDPDFEFGGPSVFDPVREIDL